jgi:hypothetical protein
MVLLNKIQQWIIFVIGGFIGTVFLLFVLTALPLFVGIWILDWNIFLFLVVGGILMSIYYYLLYFSIAFYYDYLNRRKPDYWISNILLALVTICFFYFFTTNFVTLFDKNIKIFMNFKGIMLLMAITPAYFKILYVSIISPFIPTENVH